MDRTTFTTIAHRDHRLCVPLASSRADRLLASLDLAPGARVLDVGCGKGELLVRLAERHAARGLGVDLNPGFLADGRGQAAARTPPGAVVLLERDAHALEEPASSFDAAICVGSTHALGGYRSTLLALQRLVRRSGRVLVGEGYWKQPPAAAYLEVLGGTADEFEDHDGNAAAGVALGLRPILAEASSLEEWDDYEIRYAESIERHARERGDDPEAIEMLDHVRRWHRAYRTWGRDTLGFGCYVFEV